jgi:hypothetical protein
LSSNAVAKITGLIERTSIEQISRADVRLDGSQPARPEDYSTLLQDAQRFGIG